MKHYIALLFILTYFFNTKAQKVGILTNTPETTLDVRALNHLGAVSASDGVLVPRVSSLSSSGVQNGQLVYLISNNGVFKKGFHYWDGAIWKPLDSTDGDAWGVSGEDQTSSIERSGKVSIRGSGKGSISISSLNTTNNGLIEIFRPDASREGFLGWVSGNMYYSADQGDHVFGGPTGKVGVGTIPTEQLDVSGKVKIRQIDSIANTNSVLTVDADGVVQKVATSSIAASGTADGDAWGVSGEDQTSSIERSGEVSIRGSGKGSISISSLNTVNNGLIEIFRPDASREGFLGWETGNMYYSADQGDHVFGGPTGKVGIGIVPTEQLDVNGKAKIRQIDSIASTNSILTANGSGLIQKVATSSIVDGDAWGVNGEDQTSTIFRTGYVKLGSGSNTPQANIDIQGTSAYPILRIDGTSGGDATEILYEVISSSNGTFPSVLSSQQSKIGLSMKTPQSANFVVNIRGNDNTDGFHFVYNNGANHVASFKHNGQVGIGTSNTSERLHVNGNILATGTITQSSDIQFKKEIKPIQDALKKIMTMQGVNWQWKTPSEHGAKKGDITAGVIAQQLEKVAPELVITHEGDKEFKSVNYNGLSAYFIQAIQEQQKLIENQQIELNSLKKELETIKANK